MIFGLFKNKKDIGDDVDSENNNQALLDSAKHKLESFSKTTFKPVVEAKFYSYTASKLGGLPYIPESEQWPVCPSCGKAMQFFVQLNSVELPDQANTPFGDGLMQMFYCINYDDCGDSDDWEPFSKGHLIRVIDPAKEAAKQFDSAPLENPFEEKTIIDWKALEEYPHYEEQPEDIELSDEEGDALMEHALYTGEKLLGWPYWVQGEEYPLCPKCNEKMSFIFQIDSEDNFDYMFGDVGCGHITQCKQHPEIIAFTWACC